MASLRKTITNLCPKRSFPSSRTSAIPLSFPSLTSSAIRRARLSGFTWYGSSVITRQVLLLISSISTTERIMIEPRPVRYASSIPLYPTIRAFVGKSGPFTNFKIASKASSADASGLSKAH